MFAMQSSTWILATFVLKLCGTFDEPQDDMIYILIWINIAATPFYFVEQGNEAFQECTFKNCYFTDNHDHFKSVLQFDVIIFTILNIDFYELPSIRSERQKYIIYEKEPAPATYVPVKFNGYFNLSFTYKLTSNITFPYLIVKDKNDEVIGPDIDMHWMKLTKMNEIADDVKSKLQTKRIAAAWIVSNCIAIGRMLYAKRLKEELARYGLKLDIYGECGNMECRKDAMDECYASIESDYYFYLAFENSFTEDYISEKILHALEHFTVPVVLGGANYSRFVPEGIYLDATSLSAKEMAEKMHEIIKDENKYYEFFKWHNHYSFHFSGEMKYFGLCKLCDYLNKNRNQTSTIEYVSQWWNEVNISFQTTDEEWKISTI